MSYIWSVCENSTTWLAGFQLGLLPAGLESQVRIVTRGGEIGLEVGGIVGSVLLTNGDTLHIKPKVGEINFFKMLLTAEDLYDELKNQLPDVVSYGVDDVEPASFLVARALLIEISKIFSLSPRFERKKVLQNGKFARGRMLVLDTKVRMKLGSEYPVTYEHKIRDFDTAENRVLAEAARVALGYLSDAKIEQELRYTAGKWIHKFSDRRRITDDVATITAKLSRNYYAGARGYYVRPLTLAKIILGQEGLCQGRTSQVFGDAIVINMANLFEEYVRAVLSQRYRQEGIVIQKGANPPEFLYSDGTCNLQPDITFSRGAVYSAIADAKYKLPDPGDHYQMAAYMSVFRGFYGIVLCPVYKKNEAGIIERKTFNGRTVFEVRLPLDDLEKADKMLTTLHLQIPFL